jgi:lipopolysaccharide export system permease protein
MNRIGRMISRMIFLRFMAILLGLTLFVLTLEFVTYVNEILALENTAGIAFKYLAVRAPATLATFLPMSLLLALLLTITELSYRNELTAIWAMGVSPLGFILMLTPLVLLIGGLHFIIVDRLVPASAPQLRAWGIADYGEKKLKIGERDPLWLRSGPDIMRAASASADSRRLADVVIFRRDAQGKLLEQIFASAASLDEKGWTLQNTTTYYADNRAPEQATNKLYQGKARPAEAGYRSGDPEEMNLGELSYFIDNAGFGIRPTHVYQTWWHKRITPFFISFVMLALCVPLGMKFRRGGGLGKLFAFGVGLGFGFFVLDGIALSVGELGIVTPWLAAWLPVMVFGLFAFYLISKSERV